MTLRWTKVPGASYYRVKVWEGTDTDGRVVSRWNVLADYGDDESGVVSGLDNGTTYTFKIHAMFSTFVERGSWWRWTSGADSRSVTATPGSPPPARCSTALTGDGSVSGRWSGRYEFGGGWVPNCFSVKRGANHDAWYYTFTLAERSEVTFRLQSADAGTHLYLWDGHDRKGGTPLAEDSGPFWGSAGFSSRVVQTLDAGHYTVEATTFAELDDGSFTLSVDGLVSPVSVAHNGSSLTVSWWAPPGAARYNVVYSDDGGGSWARAAWNGAGTSLTFACDSRPGHSNCVESGKTYIVGVQALDADGDVVRAWVNSAPASYEATPQPEQSPPTQSPPPPVTNISVTHNGSSLTVSWQAPARATHYDVVYSVDGGGSWARAAWNRAGTSLTITCDSRYPGQNRDCVSSGATYTVGVRARNAAGESEWRNSAPASP